MNHCFQTDCGAGALLELTKERACFENCLLDCCLRRRHLHPRYFHSSHDLAAPPLAASRTLVRSSPLPRSLPLPHLPHWAVHLLLHGRRRHRCCPRALATLLQRVSELLGSLLLRRHCCCDFHCLLLLLLDHCEDESPHSRAVSSLKAQRAPLTAVHALKKCFRHPDRSSLFELEELV